MADHAKAEQEATALKQLSLEYASQVTEANNLVTEAKLKNQERLGLERQLATLIEQKTLHDKTTNPYTAQMAQIKVQLEDLTILDSKLTEEIAVHDQDNANYEFWAKKFPLIRLSILDEVINELEIHFNAAFSNLGLGNWTISVSTERELKNESTKKELTLQITDGEQELDLETLSGGERQRVKLALSIGISNLIKNRAGIDWNLLMFDEPCTHLSQEGIENLLTMFKQLSADNVILLAEHRILGIEHFDKTYTIVKDSKGNSSIET